MVWWSRPDYESELAKALGRRVKVLADAVGDDVLVAGIVDGFAIRRGGVWEFVEWHLIRQGGWNKNTETLSWSLADETTGSVSLTDPRHFPEMFRERVKASILLEDRTDAPGGGAVVIVGRRPLGPTKADGPTVVWQALAEGGAKLTDAAVRDYVLERVTVLESDYSVSG